MASESQISREDFRLLNPAFLAAILTRASHGYAKEASCKMPYVFAFLIPPMVLHLDVREKLPSSIVTRLISWGERNGDELSLFPRTVASTTPATKEGILFGVMSGMLELADKGTIHPNLKESYLVAYEKNCGSSEVSEIMRKSYFVGRWLASSGLPTTVLTSMGVTIES